MDNILQPANMVDFDFSNISLKNPKPIQGGSFLSSIKNNNKALINVSIDSLDLNYKRYKDLVLSEIFFDSKK